MHNLLKIETPVPAYLQIAKHFEQDIRSGKMRNNHRLPPERLLASELKVSRDTVSKALALLSQKRLVSQHIGKGTFVSYDPGKKTPLRAIALFGDAFGNGLQSDDPYFSRLTAGLYHFFSQHMMTGVFSLPEKNFLEHYAEHNLSGVVFYAPDHKEMMLIRQLENANIPYTVISRDECDCRNCVNFENNQGTVDALEYLYGLGHRRIGFVTRNGINADSPSNTRILSYKAFLKGKKLAGGKDLFCFGAEPDVFRDFLERGRLTALFCTNFWLAMQVYRNVQQAGMKIPEDISIVSFGDYGRIAEYMAPPLTAVCLPVFEIGLTAAELLLRQIRQPSAAPCKSGNGIVLKTELIVRASCRQI